MYQMELTKQPVLPIVAFPQPKPLEQANETDFDRAFNEKMEREHERNPSPSTRPAQLQGVFVYQPIFCSVHTDTLYALIENTLAYSTEMPWKTGGTSLMKTIQRNDKQTKENNYKKDTPRKAGMSSLEMLAVFMMFMLMLGFFFDTFTILNQHYVASREANIVTRQIAIQGGVGTRQPDTHTRFGQSYETSRAINHRVQNQLRGVGSNSFNLYLNPHDEGVHTGWLELTPATILPIPYQENFEFLLEYEYEWTIMGQMIPGMGGTRTRSIQRSAVSEIGG